MNRAHRQANQAKQDARPQRVIAVGHQDDRHGAAGGQQAGGLRRILQGVARPRLDQQCRVRNTGSERQIAHHLRFGNRTRAAAAQQQNRRDTGPIECDRRLHAALDRPAGPTVLEGLGAENDDGARADAGWSAFPG
jgi:hypothetical protein